VYAPLASASAAPNLHTKFLKDEAAALMYICQSLDEDDQSLVDEYEAAHDLWAYLKLKYSRTDAVTANIYMTKIQTFTLDDGSTIIGAWDKLKGYRRKLGAADPEAKGAYTDRSLLLVLTRALPKDYKTMINSLDIQTELTVDEKIKHLEAKEMRLKKVSTRNAPTLRFGRVESTFHFNVVVHKIPGRNVSVTANNDTGVTCAANLVISCATALTWRRLG
jgi:gag-polypeptide of LTR copia-type